MQNTEKKDGRRNTASEEASEEHKEILGKMAREAVRELDRMAHPGQKEKAKRLVKRLLGRSTAHEDLIFWPAGLLLLGLVEAGHTGEAERYLDLWFDRGMPVQNPDDALAGAVMILLWEQTGRMRYQEAAEKIRNYLASCRRDSEGAVVYGQKSRNDWIYADGAGQTAMFWAALSRMEKNPRGESVGSPESDAGAGAEKKEAAGGEENQEEALRQLALFWKNGLDERTGLPYHGYDTETGLKYGIIGWGRAVGWLLFGLSSLETEKCGAVFPQTGQEDAGTGKAKRQISDEKKEKNAFREAAARLCRSTCERIRRDGLFSWQLDCLDGPCDTSASGMIYYSLLRMDLAGEKSREENRENFTDSTPFLTKKQYDKAAETLFSMVDDTGKIGGSSAECIDFAQYRQQYGSNPWGQGASLAFLALYEKTRED